MKRRTVFIDECHERFWLYGLYERRRFFGIPYTACIAKRDDVASLKDIARETLRLPIYISAGDA